MSLKTINIVGTGYSGSSAIYEFLQKTELFHDPFNNNQLSITYDPGGLIELENLIKNQFTPNKARLVYISFNKLIDYYCLKSGRLKLGKDLIKCKKDLRKILSNYISSITNLEFRGESSFINFQKSSFDKIKLKTVSRYYKFIKKKRKNQDKFIIFCDIERFYTETKNLIFELVEKDNFSKKDIILDQAGTIFNPISSVKFYKNPLSICVLRDPRDIYSEIKNITNKFPAYNLKVFVNWYKQIINKIDINEKKDKRVLFVNFEDFVMNKDKTLNKIFNMLEKDIPDLKKISFDFSKSKKNISIYKNLLKNYEINYIENNLKNYLYNF